MATYRAATFQGLLMTTVQQCVLPEADLVEAAVAAARAGKILGESEPNVTEEAFRAGLEIEDYRDGAYMLEVTDVTVTADNVEHVRAIVPAALREQVEVGETVTVRTGLQDEYEAVVIWSGTDRAAVVLDGDGAVCWGDVDGGYVTLDGEDDDDLQVVVDADTGEDVSREAETICVTLSEDGIRDQDGCDTDEAVRAVVAGVRAKLTSDYPRASIRVLTQRDGPELIEVVEYSGSDMDGTALVEEVERTVSAAVEDTIADGLWEDAPVAA